MSHESSAEYYRESNDRLWRLKRLTDYLISLAPHVDEVSVEDEAQAIVEAMKSESDPPVMQLAKLEELAKLSSHNPDEPQPHLIIDDTAEYLLEEIKAHHSEKLPNALNLSSVWASLKAWDIARSPATAELSVRVLDNYRGGGQAHLARAFIMANEKRITLDDALDTINADAA